MDKTIEITRAVVVAGLVAGTLDIGAAALINHVGPALILQGIASGLVGMKSYAGGAGTVALGLALQLAMSIVIAGIYAAAAARLAWLRSRPVLAGLAFGLGVFVVMNLIVVPLSAFGPKPAHISLAWLLLNVVAMLVFGVIVAMIVRWGFRRVTAG
ncbi:hypothetical protein [Sphingomonas asaccharolytica]|uniref:hypothetical protein n=1 Tax=Sphingomonas asaccharolytica TaxID=40681 RepID=UPI000832DC54|nr:hypothetical protein [Sphingomonas asaccharolytica]